MIKIGDKVGMSHKWLRSVGCLTDDIPRAIGIVKVIKIYSPSLSVAEVERDSQEAAKKVNVKNLAKVGTVDYID